MFYLTPTCQHNKQNVTLITIILSQNMDIKHAMLKFSKSSAKEFNFSPAFP